MADFNNIYIGGKHFTSLQEAIEYKRQHPEWDGIGQIIDNVGPGETVSFISGKQKITLSDSPKDREKRENKNGKDRYRQSGFEEIKELYRTLETYLKPRNYWIKLY